MATGSRSDGPAGDGRYSQTADLVRVLDLGISAAPITVPDDLAKYISEQINDPRLKGLEAPQIVRAALWAVCDPEWCEERFGPETLVDIMGARAYLGMYSPSAEEIVTAREEAAKAMRGDKQTVTDESQIPIDHLMVRRSLAAIELRKRDGSVRKVSSWVGERRRKRLAESLDSVLESALGESDFDTRLAHAVQMIKEYDSLRAIGVGADDVNGGTESHKTQTKEPPEPQPKKPFESLLHWTKDRITKKTVAVTIPVVLVVAALGILLPSILKSDDLATQSPPKEQSEEPLVLVTPVEPPPAMWIFWVPASVDLSSYPQAYFREPRDPACTQRELDWYSENGGELQGNHHFYEIRNVSDGPQQVSLQSIRVEGQKTEPKEPGFFMTCAEGIGDNPELIYVAIDVDDANSAGTVSSMEGGTHPLGPTFYTLQPGEVVDIDVTLRVGVFDFQGYMYMDVAQGANRKDAVPLELFSGGKSLTLRGTGERSLFVLPPFPGPDGAEGDLMCYINVSNDSSRGYPYEGSSCTAEDVRNILRDLWRDF